MSQSFQSERWDPTMCVSGNVSLYQFCNYHRIFYPRIPKDEIKKRIKVLNELLGKEVGRDRVYAGHQLMIVKTYNSEVLRRVFSDLNYKLKS